MFKPWHLPPIRLFRKKNVMSIRFLPAIPGPEMAAPILWTPGIFWFFLLENPHAAMPIKFLLLGGGGGVGVSWTGGGGGSANFIFMGAGIFPNYAGTSTSPFKRARKRTCKNDDPILMAVESVLHGVPFTGLQVLR